MKLEVSIDMDFRPADYWAPDNWSKHILANIGGAMRKRYVQKLLEEGLVAELEEELLSQALDPEVREMAGRYHPFLMGGEYLPKAGRNEVEIARVTMLSVTMDVLSVRARRRKSRILYQVRDEYGTKYQIRPASTQEPLSLRQLVKLMDTALPTGEEEGGPFQGLVFSPLDGNLPYLKDRAAMRDFVTVSSEFYPQLADYYRGAIEAHLDEWMARRSA